MVARKLRIVLVHAGGFFCKALDFIGGKIDMTSVSQAVQEHGKFSVADSFDQIIVARNFL